jgi:hypothetical protein
MGHGARRLFLRGGCWDYLPHDHSRSRAYRWGEDGLLGITDRECRLCFALALWNGKDPILKERLFGLTGPEGNHGEDVKELYYYLDATPTGSYLKGLYKYPQAAYPYEWLVEENRRRGKLELEVELIDTGVFAADRYFDVTTEYAKNAPDDIFIRITVTNCGPDRATLHVLPQLWFRNTWSWGETFEYKGSERPRIFGSDGTGKVTASHPTLGRYILSAGPGPDGRIPEALFTENETNLLRLYGAKASETNYSKDAFHRYLVNKELGAVNPSKEGTKVRADAQTLTVKYAPEESNSGLFGGNSNWRGPIWFPVNYLLVEALQRYHLFYGNDLKVECPTGSGRMLNLLEVSHELVRRLLSIFLKDASGRRAVHGRADVYVQNPTWQNLILFYEYFHGDSGRGVGASHQTGWTALVTKLLEIHAQGR